jgi:chemotaxis protein MotA
MDLGTVIGIVLIFALLLGSMVMGVGIGAYIDIPSVLIVIGGSIGALMISFKPTQMKAFTKVFMKAIKPGEEDVGALIKKLVEFATKARKDGILAK